MGHGLRHFHRKTKVGRRAARPSLVGLAPVRPMERRIDLGGVETSGMAFQMTAAGYAEYARTPTRPTVRAVGASSDRNDRPARQVSTANPDTSRFKCEAVYEGGWRPSLGFEPRYRVLHHPRVAVPPPGHRRRYQKPASKYRQRLRYGKFTEFDSPATIRRSPSTLPAERYQFGPT